MGLKDYRRKRDFKRTPEPVPTKPAKGERTFVVQKHAASSLHYDFRLRIGDVLKSWAVPKGPSLDPREKRLAVQVEDHPADYASFEGVIPAGEYGGGTVMLWDRGRWSPVEGDPAKALRGGMLKFNLEGERLKGRWVLVRTKREARQPQWLLIKERDAHASPGVHAETFATSIATGRTMDEIAAGAPHRRAPAPAASVPSVAGVRGAGKSPMPARIRPQLATPADRPPEGDDWLHEVKFDGYRLLCFRAGGSVRIRSRSGLDWTKKLPDLAAAVGERLGVDAVLDGEAVLLDSRGVSDFQALQNAVHGRRSRSIVFLAFDLPWCDGYDLTRARLDDRRALLTHLLGTRQDGRVRLSEHVEGAGPAAFRRACAAGLEGIVSKRRSAPYAQTRATSWVKVKCFNQQEFVVGGFTPPEGSREQFGALLVGYYDGGALRYAGKVGTGFSTETLRALAGRLREIAAKAPSFADPPRGPDAKGVTWVRPEVVVQVRFRDWSRDGIIRHPSFRGVREESDPSAVTREPSRGAPAPPDPPPADLPAPPARGRLTSPGRVVYPDRGAGYALTKAQVAEYYEAVAPRMLPHVAGRPLAVLRCPGGEGAKAFFQKHPAKGMPASVLSVDIHDASGGRERYLCITDAEGLLGLVQMNVLEFHPWGARVADAESPDRLVFDLDPGEGVTWRQVVEGATMVRDALGQMGLRGFARVSGGKGVHVVVPLKRGHTWEQAKAFSRAAADALVRVAPGRFVAKAGAANRGGRVFIDYLRNARGATAIAAYSTRARPGAPVALPVAWDELAGLGRADAMGVPAVLRRLRESAPDPWEGLDRAAGSLPPLSAAPGGRTPARRVKQRTRRRGVGRGDK